MKTLKAFSLEFSSYSKFPVFVFCDNEPWNNARFNDEKEAFDWLEANGYIERKNENTPHNK